MNSQSIFGDPFGLVVLLVVAGTIALLVSGLARLCIAYRGVRGPLLFVIVGVGGLAGYGVLRTSSSYLASLTAGQTIFMVLLIAIVSVVFAAIPRTRRHGLIGLIGASAMLAGFYAVYLGGVSLGLHAWANDRPVPLP
jgi:hypothetical protein